MYEVQESLTFGEQWLFAGDCQHSAKYTTSLLEFFLTAEQGEKVLKTVPSNISELPAAGNGDLY